MKPVERSPARGTDALHAREKNRKEETGRAQAHLRCDLRRPLNAVENNAKKNKGEKK